MQCMHTYNFHHKHNHANTDSALMLKLTFPSVERGGQVYILKSGRLSTNQSLSTVWTTLTNLLPSGKSFGQPDRSPCGRANSPRLANRTTTYLGHLAIANHAHFSSYARATKFRSGKVEEPPPIDLASKLYHRHHHHRPHRRLRGLRKSVCFLLGVCYKLNESVSDFSMNGK